MNITQEDKGNLTKLVKIEIQPEDYKESVDKQLKDYQKKAQEPGFRIGKVPFGIINKKYGKAVRLDEINKLLSDKINSYIEDSKLNILGQPLANQDHDPKGDFGKDDTFEFYFDLGIAPDFDLDLENREFDFYRIKLDEKQVGEYVENIRNQNGSQESVDDEVKEGDIVKGVMTELDENGQPKEDGIVKEDGMLSVDYIKDEELQNALLGKKKEDTVTFNAKKVANDNDTELASMLGMEKEEAAEVDSDFSMKIAEVVRNKPAELNEELYKKMYPNEEITTEDEFRAKVKEDAEKAYERESERLLLAVTSDKLVDDINIELPDEFLKRWLLQNDENLTPEKLEKDYDRYSRTMQWQLIENEIIKTYNVEVKDEEVKEQIRGYFMQQMGGGEVSDEMKKQLDPIVDQMMQNKEQTKQIYDQLFDEGLARAVKENASLNVKEVTYDEFVKIAQEQQPKDHDHDHDHDHEGDEAHEDK